MPDVYIVGFDGTKASHRAVDHAATIAKTTQSKIHLVHVIEWSPYSFHTPQELAERHNRREQELERARSVVQPIVSTLQEDGIDAECESRHGDAADLLCEIATELEATQIIIGRTGDSKFAQRLLGGLAVTLAQVAPVPVTIVP